MKILATIVLLAFASHVAAQTLPQPGPDNPRLQTVRWQPGGEVQLTVLPDAGLTVMLEPGETITAATISDAQAWEVRVSPELDSFIVLPLVGAATGTLSMTTDRRNYSFALQTGTGLMAGLLVRFEYGPPLPELAPVPFPPAVAPPLGGPELTGYRFRGDRQVRPEDVRDDGTRTWITFGPDQALPAVFAVGPTGEEEVVNGHMRDGLYVIDRVYEELVFRIDRRRATARREIRGDERG